jgi:carbon monoxide dehydrogenase subunit G
MKITHEFTVSAPPAEAWAVLTDLEAIAPCMPGASLTGFDGETYQGKVRVKLGPVISDFGGTARFTEKDDATHHAVIDAKGKDTRGAGNATARITADLKRDGAGTLVSVDTDLTISGKVAQFGSSMIKQVSEKLLAEFTTCLESKLAAGTLGAAPPSDVPPSTPEPAPMTPDQAATASASPAVAPTSKVTAADINATASDPKVAASHQQSGASGPKGTAEQKRAAAGRVSPTATEEPAPLDLMQLAGGTVAKRLIPALAVVVVVAVVIYLLVR